MGEFVGRPSDMYNEPKKRAILRLIRKGVPGHTAAGALGVERVTWDKWKVVDRAARLNREEGLTLTEFEQKCVEFFSRVRETEQRWLAGAVIAAEKLAIDARNSPAVLEILRRHPVSRPEWNVPERMEYALVEQEPPDDPEQLLREISRLERIAKERASEQFEKEQSK